MVGCGGGGRSCLLLTASHFLPTYCPLHLYIFLPLVRQVASVMPPAPAGAAGRRALQGDTAPRWRAVRMSPARPVRWARTARLRGQQAMVTARSVGLEALRTMPAQQHVPIATRAVTRVQLGRRDAISVLMGSFARWGLVPLPCPGGTRMDLSLSVMTSVDDCVVCKQGTFCPIGSRSSAYI